MSASQKGKEQKVNGRKDVGLEIPWKSLQLRGRGWQQ